MIRIPLPGDANALLLSPRWSMLAPIWQWSLIGLLLFVPAGLVLWLYRYELRLVTRAAAAMLLGLRLLLITLLWAVAAWQPIVAHEVTEELPSRVLIAVDRSGSMDVRDPQRNVLEKLRLARALKLAEAGTDSLLDSWIQDFERARSNDEVSEPDALQRLLRRVDDMTRSDAARRTLTPEGVDLIAQLARRHNVGLLGFDREAWSIDRATPDALFAARSKDSTPLGTDLRQPLLKAPAQGSAEGGPLLGVIVLTDGQHNLGGSPLAQAKELAARGVPIYPIALGARQPPPDIAVVEVRAPPTAFKDVDTPVDARIKVTGLPAQEIRIELHRPGKPLGKDNIHTLKHDGVDRTYAVSFQTRLEEAGNHRLEVTAAPADPATREVTAENNALAAVVRVGAEKIRVLLVDGEARWEYHYVAAALARDKAVTLDRVLFLQPRLGAIPEDKLEKLGNPALQLPELKDKTHDPLGNYDCIILGDVPADKLDIAERRRLERYVVEHGGTLMVVAGKRDMPLEYVKESVDDPLAKLLPIANPRVASREEGFPVTLTRAGLDTPFLRLEATRESSAERWAELPRHYWAIVGAAKPGAEALAFVVDDNARVADGKTERRTTLFARQPYGFGRVLYFGLDSTWRWRYRTGDVYHHRVWGQVIRWAAAEKLLPAGNRFVRYGSRAPLYRHGEAVEIAVRLLEDTPLLKPDAVARARIVPEGKSEAVALVPLRAAENQPRWLQGKALDLPAGNYRIELDIPALQEKIAAPAEPDEVDGKGTRRDLVVILPPENSELFDLATNWTLLDNLAAESRGAVYTPENAQELVERFARQVTRRDTHQPQRLWQDPPLVWWLLGGFLTLLTLEWIIRKASGLA
jgi:hypothetical protein